MKKIVMKFGGSSLVTGENIRNVASLVASYVKRGYRVVVVVSALKGVTDNLIEAAESAKKGISKSIGSFKNQLLEKHVTITGETIEKINLRKEIENLLIVTSDELEKVLTGIMYIGELTPKSKDYVLSFGERLSTPIVWGALRDAELHAQYYTGSEVGIVTNDNFGEAIPLLNVSKLQIKANIESSLEQGIVPVVTGYIAATQDGTTTTLGRGGSDYTATVIAVAIEADEVWIWTDADGLMTSDPRIVPKAKMLPELSFQEAAELTFGVKVMHPRALEPVKEEDIPVRIRNVFNPENPGTIITKTPKKKYKDAVKAVTMVNNTALINVSGAGMIGTPGIAAKVFDILGRKNINILMISQSVSETNISFVIRRNVLDKAINTLEIALLGTGLIREITAEDDVCVISVVGAGMRGTPGIASRVFTAIAQRGINIRMIAQGSSELNISFIVKESHGERAVQAIHDEYKLDRIHPT